MLYTVQVHVCMQIIDQMFVSFQDKAEINVKLALLRWAALYWADGLLITTHYNE